jgi:hypothetical protein
MNKYCLIGFFAGLLGCGFVSAEVSREVRRIRTNAVNELSYTLPCDFITKKHFLKALQFIEQDLPDKVHQKLLKMQAKASELYEKREQVLMIPGITEKDPLVQCVDVQLVGVEKELDNMLYNDGIFNWKSMLAFGIAAGVGACAGTGHLYGMRDKSGLLRGVVVGLIVAILLEYAVRGRRAIIAGNAYMGLCFVLRVVFKFLGKVFDCGGHLDKFGAKVERKFRTLGAKLDKVFGKKSSTATITALASVAIVFALGVLIKRHYSTNQSKQA